MPIDTSGSATGTMDPIDVKYLAWDPPASPVSIHMHPGVAEGIARDVAASISTPTTGVPIREIGGLLLGRVVAGSRPAVWIERYKQISCEHFFGPQFILDGNETKALEMKAATILATGEFAVVGLYRSHARPGFQLEESDFDLIERYFSDPSDLILLVKPKSESDISAQFFAWDGDHSGHPVSDEIPFREGGAAADSAPEAAAPEAAVPVVAKESPRRLVPDFLPSPVEPAPSLYGLGQNFIPEESTKEHDTRGALKKWLPLAAALLLVGGIVWLLIHSGGHGPANAANSSATTAQAERPLGLYVDPAGPNWRVLWNPNATALRDARNVQLFVREKEDQNFIPLSERDRASGTYQYRPTGNDVTFRLEVTDRAGRVSAESFRIMQAPSAPAPAAPAPAPAPARTARTTQPKAVYKAPPVIAAGVRPRIKGTIPIDVRVQIDVRGHVVSATPVAKPHSGLDQYLAGRAVQAAKLWRFEPARENGKPVAGSQILHFVFEK